ncbi:ParB/RepB/Spo0J family partition protein [Micromonospora sp. NPDC006766]|uniref:ParB/RepB/Spo0J family partition protein n=1 Tax=Micromonospora sp. NPDC006766 TaxID=3154778 RepID=UPI0033E2FA33
MATPAVAADHAFLRIPIDAIEPGPNVRGEVGDVAELAANLRAVGQLMPVLVEPLPDGRYQLLDGHRRHAAASMAGIGHLMAVVRHADDNAVRRTVRQLSIQAHAQPFDPMAEARALHKLMFEQNLTREAISRMVGKSTGWVRDRISLVHLEPGEQRDVQAGSMSVSEALFRLSNRRAMREGRQPTQQRRQATRSTAAPGRPAAQMPMAGRRGQIIALLADGASAEGISTALGISLSTAKTHIQSLYQHLGARNAAHAVHLAYEKGLLRSPGCVRCAPDEVTAR